MLKSGKWIFFIFICLIILTSGCGMSRLYTEEFSETYSVSEGMKVSVFNKNGSINISRWDNDELKVYAEKSTNWGEDELEKVEIEVIEDEELVIKTEHKKKFAKVSVKYDIKVPDNVVISRVETSNGNIELTGTKGPSSLATSNGNINVKNATEDINGNTSNGGINIEKLDGYIDIGTSNGMIKVRDIGGITRLKTSNGSINAEVPTIKGEKVNITTSNGNIKLYISEDIDADIEFNTSMGSITLHDFDIDIIEKEKTYLEGKMGGGGPDILVNTSNGSINIYKL